LEIALLVALAGVGLAVTIYAQHRVPYHTGSRTETVVARGVLIATGGGLGVVSAIAFAQAGVAQPLLVFLVSFGLVHAPAAAILWLKRKRGL